MVVFASIKSALTLQLYGVLQGFVSGTLLFNLYMADVIKIAEFLGVRIHCYANYVQLYIHCIVPDAPTAVTRLLTSIGAIENWMMGSNKLKINVDTIQLIWLSIRKMKTLQLVVKMALLYTLQRKCACLESSQTTNLQCCLMPTASCVDVFITCGSYVQFDHHKLIVQLRPLTNPLYLIGLSTATRCSTVYLRPLVSDNNPC